MLKMFHKEEIEKLLGSSDLKVGFFSYMVVYLEREESTNFRGQSFIHSKFQTLLVGNIVQLEPCARWAF